MARYTRSLSVALSLSNCLTQLKAVLESCDLEALFSKEDCIIAREKPGKVPFAKLVTIEVLVDSTRATSNVTNMDVVVKNEELPLQSNNHCFQIFDQFSQAINQHSGWQVIAEAEEPNQSQTASAESPATPTTATTPQATLKIETAPAAQPLASEPIAPVSANAQAEPVVQLPKAADLPLPQSFTDTAPEPATPPESAPSNMNDSMNLEPTAEKRVQTTANLEELRQKRAESVANLERLRQKRAESIANLEKMRQKRERMFAANEREGTGEDISSLDLPERPSTSQA